MSRSLREQIAEHQEVVAGLTDHLPLLERIVESIVARFKQGGKLYVLGNGGSAADAQHIAAEFVGRFKRDRRALPAVALTTDTSILTAVTNDIGGEQIFARQVEALATRHDVIWALSVSGRSPNILSAMSVAQRIGAFRIGFTGRTGEHLAGLCDLCLRVDHTASDRVQEVHQLAYHLICDAVEYRYAG